MVNLKFQDATTRVPTGTDIIPFVKDPAGTPLDGKATIVDIVAAGLAQNLLPLAWQGSDQCIDNTIEWVCPFSSGAFTNAEVLRRYPMHADGTLKSMYVYVELSSGETNGIPYTVRVNGADTALTVTQTLNTTGIFEVIADVAVLKEDFISFQCDNTGNFGGTRTGAIVCMFEES